MSLRAASRLMPFGSDLKASSCFGLTIATTFRTDTKQHTTQIANRPYTCQHGYIQDGDIQDGYIQEKGSAAR